MTNRFVNVIAMITVLFGATVGSVSAEPRGENRRAPPRPGFVLDNRFHHDHYYPPRGFAVDAVPRGAYVAPRWNGRFFFNEGAWYRRSGPRFVVVAPPIGLVVPFLPPFYTTIWVGGFPYYYANDTYYAWRPEERGYVVVDPPRDAEQVATQPAPDDIFIYPKQGQSEDQQATDRYECHRWAAGQTNYDPTTPAEGDSPAAVSNKRADYHRAMKACLDARGYSVQ